MSKQDGGNAGERVTPRSLWALYDEQLARLPASIACCSEIPSRNYENIIHEFHANKLLEL